MMPANGSIQSHPKARASINPIITKTDTAASAITWTIAARSNSLQIGSDDVKQLLSRFLVERSRMFIRIDQMQVHVVFDDLGHETRHGAARARYEVRDLLARRLSLKSTFYALNLSPKSTNACQQLFLIANRMTHFQSIAYPPSL